MTGAALTAPRVQRPRRRGDSPAGAAPPLLIACACLLALALVWVLAELVPATQAKDAAALYHFTLVGGDGVQASAREVLHLVEPLLFPFWAVALVAIAIARGKPRVALAVAVVTGLAPLCADRLKPLVAYHHTHVAGVFSGYGSWPSGHAAAAAALGLSATLVAPARMRMVVGVLGAGFSLLIGAALLVRAWHMPSDVIGGYLVAMLLMALAVAGLRAAERRWPSGREP